jgi:hypothetical protein
VWRIGTVTVYPLYFPDTLVAALTMKINVFKNGRQEARSGGILLANERAEAYEQQVQLFPLVTKAT